VCIAFVGLCHTLLKAQGKYQGWVTKLKTGIAGDEETIEVEQ
jgi:hypothetical protein